MFEIHSEIISFFKLMNQLANRVYLERYTPREKAFKIYFNLNLIQIWAKFASGNLMDNDTWGVYFSMDHALEMIRESKGISDGYALIADATDVR